MASKGCIVIVDDDQSVLDSTSALLGSLGYETHCFALAEDFLSAAPGLSVDCLLLDVRMPGMGGLELQERLIEQGDPPPIVFITAHGDIPMAVAAIRSGAADFIEKPFTPAQLADAMEFARSYRPGVQDTGANRRAAQERIARLTDREREVFELIVLGETNKTIGRKLDISPRTVDVHRQRLRSKLDAERLADLIRLKQDLG